MFQHLLLDVRTTLPQAEQIVDEAVLPMKKAATISRLGQYRNTELCVYFSRRHCALWRAAPVRLASCGCDCARGRTSRKNRAASCCVADGKRAGGGTSGVWDAPRTYGNVGAPSQAAPASKEVEAGSHGSVKLCSCFHLKLLAW